jgi:phi LC3 family holin
MKINWKARFKNKTFLITFITLVVAFVYQTLGLFDILPSVSENELVNLFTMLVNILAFAGVIVDPTTDGFNDSDRAMLYFTDYDERILDE